jgi:hypothetical protein
VATKTEMRTVPAHDCPAVVDVTCDGCGESVVKHRDADDLSVESARLSASWGYFSESDMSNYDFEICEDCFYKALDHLGLDADDVRDSWGRPYPDDEEGEG